MWGTVVLEIYGPSEREAVVEALAGLCDPMNGYGFASGGIYCFWDPATRSVLYIGRSANLTKRFREHVPWIKCEGSVIEGPSRNWLSLLLPE
jgi:hypothetical protein